MSPSSKASARTAPAVGPAVSADGPEVGVVAEYVTRRTGTVMAEAQLRALGEFVAGRFRALGFVDGKRYVERLSDAEEFRALVDSLTVQETFFFRFEAQLEAFRKHYLPLIVQKARGQNRRARIWSAGCCTGEEPYTLAILAAEAGFGDDVEILGTDINAGYLEQAMNAVYVGKALRDTDPAILARYFAPSNAGQVLSDKIRKNVSFRWLNLAEGGFPSFLNGTNDVDAIFCRNVLIYLEPQRVKAIIERFTDCLVDGGILALGHSEMCQSTDRLIVERQGEAFFCRKSQPDRKRRSPVELEKAASQRAAARVIPIDEARAKLRPKPSDAEAVVDTGDWFTDIERRAEKGDMAGALVACRLRVQSEPLDPRGHYLLGLLEGRDPAKAREAFKRAVYLDHEYLLARLHLARAAEKSGVVAEALREYRLLEKQAAAKPPEQLLDEREGISFGLLRLLCSRAIEGLDKKRS